MEALNRLSVRDMVHFTHCISCHLSKCEMKGSQQCQIVQCPQCYVSMHECKIEDHMAEICCKTFTPCINACYGCSKLIRRDRKSKHLEICSASVVVCGREWDRCVLSPKSKLQLKKWGKKFEAEPPKANCCNLSLDVALAISDQNMIIQSYGFSRYDRVRRRDGLHPSHPVLPLREIRDFNGAMIGTSEFSDERNSSDEEIRIKEAKLRKKRAMFANCYMCQIDPSSQHLHTLGNESVRYEETKRMKARERELDSFHKIYNLQINFSPDTLPEFLVRGENIAIIRSGGSLYTRRCLKTFRRDEYSDHHLTQHMLSINSLSDLVVRCPNWQRGCTFSSTRLRPKYGMMRFLASLDSISFLPFCRDYYENTSPTRPFDSLPTSLIITLLKYLPTSAIRSLSQTSRSLRSLVFTFARERSMVSILWKKCGGCWVEGDLAIDFSVAEKTPEYCWEPARGLSDHLASCEYGDVFEYGDKRVPVLSSNLQEITDEFMKRLPHFT